MYYKTLRNSETGLKFQAIEKLKDECTMAIAELSEKYGFKRWRHANFVAWGGLSAVLFSENDDDVNSKRPNPLFWKEVRGGYLPKRNTVSGKKAYQEFQDIPFIKPSQFNSVVGYKPDNPWSHIGASFSNQVYFLFQTTDSEQFDCPSDCEEIIFSEYKTLSIN